MLKRFFILPLCFAMGAPLAHAEEANFFVTPFIGGAAGGEVIGQGDQSETEFDIEAAPSFSLALELPVDNGRVGLFYSNQSSELEKLNLDVDVHYAHFQSSVYYDLSENTSGYIGMGLGASYVDADWVDENVGFSASFFGGFDYLLSEHVSLNFQMRWLGTAVDNETSTQCNLPSNTNSDKCRVVFDTDWMNQGQANLGITFRF